MIAIQKTRIEETKADSGNTVHRPRGRCEPVSSIWTPLEPFPVLPEEHSEAVLKTAEYQEEHGMTTFDSLHAGLAETRNARILSSEGDYDVLDIERVRLEGDNGG